MQETQPPWPLAARLGLWGGSFSWLLVLVFVTLPDTSLLAGPLVGAAAITLATALCIEAVVRSAPRPGLAVAGAAWCALGVIGAYYTWILNPSFQAVPGLVERLANHGIGVMMQGPPPILGLVIGTPLLIAGLRPNPAPDEQARSHA